YANPSFAVIVGRPLETLDDAPLSDVVVAPDSVNLIERLLSESAEGVNRLEVTIARSDGVRRLLEISTRTRRQEGNVVGFQGVVRDVTSSHDLETAKNEFLALITHDLRNPLTTILGLGATLETYAADVPLERIQRMGVSIRRQAERISRLADDL